MGYVHVKGCIFHYFEYGYPRLHGILTYASHQDPSPNHVTIMCVQMTYTYQKGLLHLSYIPRDLDYNISHNTCEINEFPPLYIQNGYKGYNYNDACGITLFYNIRVILFFKMIFYQYTT